MNPSRPVILHIFADDVWAGAEVAIFNLLNQLRETSVWSLTALALNEGALARRLRSLGIETLVVPEATMSFPGICVAAHRLLRQRAIEIIHSHGTKANLLALVLGRSLGARRLMSTLHGLSEPPARPTVRVRATARLDRLVLRRFFDRIVTVSAELKRVHVGTYRFRESRVEVIHNGIPVPATVHRAAATSDVLHIGSVGRLVPVKRFDLFLEVAAHVQAETERVRFSLLGDGPLRSELLAKAKALGLDERVTFLRSQPDPLTYYQSLDIYLNTSLHEGLPLSVLEVMACAKPVVAPRVGGIPEIVSHGAQGLLVDSSEPREFARSCMNLIANGQLRAAMGECARRTVVDRFRDTQMAEGYRRLYRELTPDSSLALPVAAQR